MLKTGSVVRFKPSLSLVLLIGIMLLLLLGGGASRGDAMGQVLIRAASLASLIIICIFGNRPYEMQAQPVWILLSAALVCTLLQLVPLPPGVWQSLPGRAYLADAAFLSGQPQPWRPLSVAPGATLNAAISLIVPFIVLLLATSLNEAERAWLPGFLLCLVIAGMLIGLLQFSGASFNNPLINDVPGHVSGTFANRNHFAVFLAMGCLLAPAWAFLDGRQPRWRAPAALGLIILFTLTILASGSRAGLLVGAVALALGVAMVWRGLRTALRRYPRWVSFALPAGALALILIFALISVAAGRAVSIDRAFALDQGQDMRTRGLPTVLGMIHEYFPFGSGSGTFDTVFRSHEPFGLLKPSYFNHAHNDLLEIVLDLGLPGFSLLAAALVWWLRSSEKAWRAGPQHVLPKLGSAMLLLVVFASAFDYPARTPLMMAMVVIAAIWLSQIATLRSGSALPTADRHL